MPLAETIACEGGGGAVPAVGIDGEGFRTFQADDLAVIDQLVVGALEGGVVLLVGIEGVDLLCFYAEDLPQTAGRDAAQMAQVILVHRTQHIGGIECTAGGDECL